MKKDLKMPIYEHEAEFIRLFDNAINDICYHAEIDEPLTLKQVIKFGFNNVSLNGKKGYEEDYFPKSWLKKKVSFDYWDYDADGYRIVYLKEVK